MSYVEELESHNEQLLKANEELSKELLWCKKLHQNRNTYCYNVAYFGKTQKELVPTSRDIFRTSLNIFRDSYIKKYNSEIFKRYIKFLSKWLEPVLIEPLVQINFKIVFHTEKSRSLGMYEQGSYEFVFKCNQSEITSYQKILYRHTSPTCWAL
jgi:hypothetical protein